jgi:uncharacterized membrane protein
LSDDDNNRVVAAIKSCEKLTSGEIRVYIESSNPSKDTLERAGKLFFKMKMQETKQRNAVLLYIALKDKKVALFGDEGIHQQVGSEFWNQQVNQMIELFKNNSITDGIIKCINEVGNVLVQKFPYNESVDKNELSDEIVFGK